MIKTSEIILTSGTRAHVAAVRDAFASLEVLLQGPADILARRTNKPAMLFVDWLMTEMAGIELIRQLRASPASPQLHLTMVLDDDDGEARRRALQVGADDYLVGPLTPERLVERLRRARGQESARPVQSTLHLGALTVDPAAYAVSWQGRDLPLRVNELNLLIHFARRPNRVFTRSELIGALGKNTAVGDERTVDVWVSRLRRSLAKAGVPHVPRTVRALGYVMDAPAA